MRTAHALRSSVANRTRPLSLAIVGAILCLVWMTSLTAAAVPVTLNIPAASFSYFLNTTHTGPQTPCPNPVTASDPTEYRGGLEAGGGWTHDVRMPNGATVTKFSLTAEDNDADGNVYAYLVRKDMRPHAGSFTSGYGILAHVGTHGSSATVRRIATTTIKLATVNPNFGYYVEIVTCNGLVNPVGIQVTFTK